MGRVKTRQLYQVTAQQIKLEATYIHVPSRPQVLTKVNVKAKVNIWWDHSKGPKKEVKRLTASGVAKRRRRQNKASPREGVANTRRRQAKASPREGVAKPGIDSVTPRYPWVGKTVEGVTPREGLRPR